MQTTAGRGVEAKSPTGGSEEPRTCRFKNLSHGAAFRSAMEAVMRDYKNSLPGDISIWTAASSYPPPGGSFATGSEAERDTWWRNFRSMYLSEKQRLQYAAVTQVAIAGGCYNGCIGTDAFYPGRDGFFNPFDLGFGFFDPDQNCYWGRFPVFAKKAKRFPGVNDIINTGTDLYGDPQDVLDKGRDIAYKEIFANCGQCPLAFDLQQLLSALASPPSGGPGGPRLTTNFTLNTSTVPELSFALYSALPLSQPPSDSRFHLTDFSWTVTGVTGTTLSVRIEETPVSEGACDLTLSFPSGDPHDWNDVKSFKLLRATPGGTAADFTATAVFADGSEAEVSGFSTCLDIAGCDVGLFCTVTQATNDLLPLFHTLAGLGRFTQTTDLNADPYPALLTDALRAFFPEGANSFAWNVQSVSATAMEASLTGIGGLAINVCPFDFGFAFAQPPPGGQDFDDITEFLSIEVHEPGAPQVFIAQVRLASGDIVGVTGSTNCFPAGTCRTAQQEFEARNCTTGIITVCRTNIFCDPPDFDGIPYENPCRQHLKDIALKNAEQAYRRYIDELRNDFRERYLAKCLGAQEEYTMTYGEREHHYTLYYYDQAGNLVRTVPPQGVNPIEDANALASIKAHRADRQNNPRVFTTHGLFTTYTYNSLNQLVRQETPDGGTTRFFYDRLGRLVVSQNAKQAAGPPPTPPQGGREHLYSYTLYDGLGRISEVGEIATDDPIEDQFTNGVLDDGAFGIWSAGGQRTQVTRTFYDEALFTVPDFAQDNLRSRVASVTIDQTDDGDDQTYDHGTHYSYDIHGNVKSLVQDNAALSPLGGAGGGQHRYKRVEYTYDLVSGNVNEVCYQPGQADQFRHAYGYDADNRIREVFTSAQDLAPAPLRLPPKGGGAPALWDKDAHYTYYKHGPLARTELGDLRVQGMDYAYTVQGWVKGVNATALDPQFDMGHDGLSPPSGGSRRGAARDAFGYTLGYFSGDYLPVDQSAPQFEANTMGSGFKADAPDLFNGNISHMTTARMDDAGERLDVQGTAYRYDQLNRLNRMLAHRSLDESANQWAPISIDTAQYSVHLNYDANGNILHLRRNGGGDGPVAMDELAYEYYPANNQLRRVGDNAPDGNYTVDIDNQPPAFDNYAYDEIGNLISDRQENIEEIKWTVYGKVSEVIRKKPALIGGTGPAPPAGGPPGGGGGPPGNSDPGPPGGVPPGQVDKVNQFGPDLLFRYDANGNRVEKTVKRGKFEETWVTFYYVRDASGNIMAVYQRSYEKVAGNKYKELFKLKEHHIYGSSRLGIRNADSLLCTTEFTAGYDNTTGAFVNRQLISQTCEGEPQVEATLHRQLGKKQYELTNHLGNVIVTVSDRKLPVADNLNPTVAAYYEPDVSTSTDYYPFGMMLPRGLSLQQAWLATMEESRSVAEAEDFPESYHSAKKVVFAMANHTDTIPGSRKVLEVKHNDDKVLYKRFAVNEGDSVSVEAYTKYFDDFKTLDEREKDVLVPLGLNRVAETIAPEGSTFDKLIDLMPVVVPISKLNRRREMNEQPVAWLNYRLYDKDSNLVKEEKRPITLRARDDGKGKEHERLDMAFGVADSGFAEVFISGGGVEGKKVYFDDYRIEVSSAVASIEEFKYPFGFGNYLMDNEWSGIAGADYEFDGYGYDSHTGRRKKRDPLGEIYPDISPYSYVRNRPFDRIDPSGQGDEPIPVDYKGKVKTGPPTILLVNGQPNRSAYNCHSWAWREGQGDPYDPANRDLVEKGITKWDNNPLNNTESFSDIPFETPNQLGDRIIYFAWDANQQKVVATHSAIVTKVDEEGNAIEVESKWGQSYRYRHHPRDIDPSYGDIDPTFVAPDGNTYPSRVYFRTKTPDIQPKPHTEVRDKTSVVPSPKIQMMILEDDQNRRRREASKQNFFILPIKRSAKNSSSTSGT